MIITQEAQGQPLPSGRHLLTVPVEKSEEGALRPLPFAERQHSLLCEELKHLYTAITRAKNNGATSLYALLCRFAFLALGTSHTLYCQARTVSIGMSASCHLHMVASVI